MYDGSKFGSSWIYLIKGEAAMKRNFAICFLVFSIILLFTSISSARRAIYEGLNGCKCHKAEIDDWKVSRHGTALVTLTTQGRTDHVKKVLRSIKLDEDKDYSKDKKCMPCHTTGYDEPGG